MCDRCDRLKEFLQSQTTRPEVIAAQEKYLDTLASRAPGLAVATGLNFRNFAQAHGAPGSDIRTAFNNMMAAIDAQHSDVRAEFDAKEAYREAMLKDANPA